MAARRDRPWQVVCSESAANPSHGVHECGRYSDSRRSRKVAEALALLPPDTSRNHVKPPHRRNRRSPRFDWPEGAQEPPPNFGRRRTLTALLAASVLSALCLGAAWVAVSSESRSAHQSVVERGREEREAPRTVTGKYDRGLGWEELSLEINLVDARAARTSHGPLQGRSVRHGRWITAHFRVRNRSEDPGDEFPELVAIEQNGRPHGSSPGRASIREPSLEHVRVPPKGTSDGYLSVEVPKGVRIERLELKLFGQSLRWHLPRSV